MSWLEIFSAICLLTGGAFGIIGIIGVLRFPDFYSRVHAAGITDTLCAALIMLGLILLADTWLMVAKLILILLFLLFTTPTASHALTRAARQIGYQPATAHTEPVVIDTSHKESPRD